jgi:hypothetical protein
MQYVVEIQLADDDLTERMSRMRIWLDHQGFEPRSFRVSGDGVRPRVYQVNFEIEQEAAAFAQ